MMYPRVPDGSPDGSQRTLRAEALAWQVRLASSSGSLGTGAGGSAVTGVPRSLQAESTKARAASPASAERGREARRYMAEAVGARRGPGGGEGVPPRVRGTARE